MNGCMIYLVRTWHIIVEQVSSGIVSLFQKPTIIHNQLENYTQSLRAPSSTYGCMWWWPCCALCATCNNVGFLPLRVLHGASELISGCAPYLWLHVAFHPYQTTGWVASRGCQTANFCWCQHVDSEVVMGWTRHRHTLEKFRYCRLSTCEWLSINQEEQQ